MPPASEVQVWEQAYSTELEGELERRMEMLLLQIAISLDFSMNHNHSPSQLKKKNCPGSLSLVWKIILAHFLFLFPNILLFF